MHWKTRLLETNVTTDAFAKHRNSSSYWPHITGESLRYAEHQPRSSLFNKMSSSCLVFLQRSTLIRDFHKCAHSQMLDLGLCADKDADGLSRLSSKGFILKSCATTEQFSSSFQRAPAFLPLVFAVFWLYLVFHSWKGRYLTGGLISYSAHSLLIALVFLCMSFGKKSF